MGTPEAIARAFLDYKAIGVTQFIISGCPELHEIARFGPGDPAPGPGCGSQSLNLTPHLTSSAPTYDLRLDWKH